jgi:hypothetical protein
MGDEDVDVDDDELPVAVDTCPSEWVAEDITYKHQRPRIYMRRNRSPMKHVGMWGNQSRANSVGLIETLPKAAAR